jgi:predicted ATPase
MIQSIRLRNFKVVKDSGVLPIQPMTVFVGRNGTGKSSIVESLDWTGRAVDVGAEAATEPFRQMRDVLRDPDQTADGNLNESRSWSLSLVLDPLDASLEGTLKYFISVGVDASGVLPQIMRESLRLRGEDSGLRLIRTDRSTGTRQRRSRTSVKRSTEAAEDERPFEWTSTLDPDRPTLSFMGSADELPGVALKSFLERMVFLRLSPKAIASFAPARQPRSARILDDEGLGLAQMLGELDSDTLDILIEKLRFVIEGTSALDSHKPVGPADRRYFSFKESQGLDKPIRSIPSWVLSEGTRRMTAILACLLHPRPPSLLCIEEVENGLDPWTLQYLLNELAAATQRNIQIILSSHSPYFLDRLPLDSVIYCERKGGSARFVPLGQHSELISIYQRMGVGDLYAEGLLGRGLSTEGSSVASVSKDNATQTTADTTNLAGDANGEDGGRLP